MRFGPVAVGSAAGAILAHSLRAGNTTVRKGRVLDAADVAALQAVGVDEVIVARLDPDDVHEDSAASGIAMAIAGNNVRADAPFTGRTNLYAATAGVFRANKAAVDALNRVDPAITLATLPDLASVRPGQMIATVKIIPFAVPLSVLDRLDLSPVVSVTPFRALRIGLVATTLPSLKASVMDKTRCLLDERLARSGSTVISEARVPHDAAAVADAVAGQIAAGAGLIVIFGASAVVDLADVVPEAVVLTGGRIVRLGMPVDPGNLLVLGDIGGIPAIGAPGCARSPKENGFDWVLDRLLAGLGVTSDDIAALGVGGLLMEIGSRPQPREGRAPRIAAVVLAAGSSRRMGEANKLLATVGGKPLVRLAAEAALGSAAMSLTVVTGHDRAQVEAALAGLDVAFVDNPDHAAGMSTSLRAGIAAVADDADGAIVLLGDMPEVTPAIVDRLIVAFRPDGIVVPTSRGKRGNPVLWSRRFFPMLTAIDGDTGGRRLIEANADAVSEVEIGPAAALDIDTAEDLAGVGGLAG